MVRGGTDELDNLDSATKHATTTLTAKPAIIPCAQPELDDGMTVTSSVRREARHHIPGSAGRHSKEVFGLPAYQRSKDQRDRSMLGEGRDCAKTL